MTGISDRAVVNGQILLVIGQHLLLHTSAGPLLADMRHAAGWVIQPTRMPARPGGLSLIARTPPRAPDDRQPSLF